LLIVAAPAVAAGRTARATPQTRRAIRRIARS
jgi:hypothetical protein